MAAIALVSPVLGEEGLRERGGPVTTSRPKRGGRLCFEQESASAAAVAVAAVQAMCKLFQVARTTSRPTLDCSSPAAGRPLSYKHASRSRGGAVVPASWFFPLPSCGMLCGVERKPLNVTQPHVFAHADRRAVAAVNPRPACTSSSGSGARTASLFSVVLCGNPVLLEVVCKEIPQRMLPPDTLGPLHGMRSHAE